MTSTLGSIYDIMPEKCAYSSTGELGTKFLSACVAVVFVFVDHTIMIEHRTDLELCKHGDLNEASNLLESITENIRKFQGGNFTIRCVFIIGGCNDKIKQKFSESLMTVIDDFRKEKKDPSDSPNTCLMFDFVNAIKIVEMTWSIKEDKRYEKNEPFIDIAIAHHPEDGDQYFFVRQCANLVNNVTGEKKRICCGILSYNLNNIGINTRQDQFSLNGAQFYVPTKLAETFQSVNKDFMLINESISTFVHNATRLGATSVASTTGAFMNLIEENVFDRMNTTAQNGVVVKRLK